MDGPLIRKPERAEAANMDTVRATMNMVRKAKADTTKRILIKTENNRLP